MAKVQTAPEWHVSVAHYNSPCCCSFLLLTRWKQSPLTDFHDDSVDLLSHSVPENFRHPPSFLSHSNLWTDWKFMRMTCLVEHQLTCLCLSQQGKPEKATTSLPLPVSWGNCSLWLSLWAGDSCNVFAHPTGVSEWSSTVYTSSRGINELLDSDLFCVAYNIVNWIFCCFFICL